MPGTLAYITRVDRCLLAPVSGSGIGTNKALMDRTGGLPYILAGHISTQTERVKFRSAFEVLDIIRVMV